MIPVRPRSSPHGARQWFHKWICSCSSGDLPHRPGAEAHALDGGCKEFRAFQSNGWFHLPGEIGLTAQRRPRFSALPVQTNDSPNNSGTLSLCAEGECHSQGCAAFQCHCKCFFSRSRFRTLKVRSSVPRLSCLSASRFALAKFLQAQSVFSFVLDVWA